MKYGYTALSTAIKNCAATFGAGFIKTSPSFLILEQELLFPSASPDDLGADLATWRRCAELAKRTGPTLTAPPRVAWTETYTNKEEWHALIFEAQGSMALACDTPSPAPLPASPDYGPTGRPSPGRLVRLRLTGRDVPAMIHAVTNEATGACLLTYTDVPASVLDLPMREATYVIQRAFHASFGHEPGSGQWDYWPKV